jgi:predicted nucleic acid-binding protein
LSKVSELFSRLNTLPLTLSAGRKAGELSAQLEREGRPLPPSDVLVAAIALDQNASLLTGNRKHFERIAGLNLV